MPSTTIHFPDKLLKDIDVLVKREGVSRNKFVIHACEEALKSSTGKWPDDFFHSKLNPNDLKLLKKTTIEMEAAIIKNRKNRTGVDL